MGQSSIYVYKSTIRDLWFSSFILYLICTIYYDAGSMSLPLSLRWGQLWLLVAASNTIYTPSGLTYFSFIFSISSVGDGRYRWERPWMGQSSIYVYKSTIRDLWFSSFILYLICTIYYDAGSMSLPLSLRWGQLWLLVAASNTIYTPSGLTYFSFIFSISSIGDGRYRWERP